MLSWHVCLVKLATNVHNSPVNIRSIPLGVPSVLVSCFCTSAQELLARLEAGLTRVLPQGWALGPNSSLGWGRGEVATGL